MTSSVTNRKGWNCLSRLGCPFTIPFDESHFDKAKELLDPEGFINWHPIKRVLCLASGGGQQSLLFAKLGYDVTVLDISDEQLQKDKSAAERYDLVVKCVQGDASDLSSLMNERFDLVFQPVSSPYILNIGQMFDHVTKILNDNGAYYSEHFNPVWHQLPDGPSWHNDSYRIVKEALPLSPITQTNWQINNERVVADPVIVYAHSFGSIIGSICDAGLKISKCKEGFLECGHDKDAEQGSLAHISAFFPPVLRLLAERS